MAGPNGAGKTTLVLRRLEPRIIVVNPDAIAFAIPRIDGRLDQRRAGEIAIQRRATHLARGDDFAIETTLTGNSALRFMTTAKRVGYKTTLVYIGLASADLSVQRVLDRVRQGGHAVPVAALQRRYADSLSKVARAAGLADRSYIFDNSDRRRRLLAIIDQGETRYLVDDLPEWAAANLASLLARRGPNSG